MPGDQSLQLLESQASRRRAWAALQDIRVLLRKAAVADLAPIARPPRFEIEGRALAQGLEQTLRKIEIAIEDLTAAMEAARPYLLGEQRDGFPQIHLRLNRALSKANELLPLLPRSR